MFYKLKNTLVVAALLPLAFGCKKEATKIPIEPDHSFISKAQQFAIGKMPMNDYAKLDWTKAVEYNINATDKMLRVPLRGNTRPGQKAAYLAYKNDKFSGNYFELANNTVTTLSLDNAKKCVAPLTANRQVQDYTVYENGLPVGDGTGMAVVIRPPMYFYNNYNLYCLIEILGLGQGGSGDPNTGQQGVVSYLAAPPDGSELGSGGGGILIDYSYLNAQLTPTDEQYQWLVNNPMEAAQVCLYLQSSMQPDKVTIAREHLNGITGNANYMNFVLNHTTTTNNPVKVWWEDSTWLDNPSNFNLDIDHAVYEQYDKLTAAEKALVKIYPVQAGFIKLNMQKSIDMALFVMGVGTNNGLNDKRDAFRHAFFNAVNTRDVPPRLGTAFPASSSVIVKLFADAHETETPPQLQLEVQVDKFNNQVGIDYCWNCYPSISTDASIATDIKAKLLAGLLLYLSPLDPFNYPRYNKDNPNCANCTNGIIPSVTVLTPTNQ